MPAFPLTVSTALAAERRRELQAPSRHPSRRRRRPGRVTRWARGWFDRSVPATALPRSTRAWGARG
jgi:hypothetical protein